MVKTKEYYMRLALKEALKAKNKDEVPVGAIIVKDGKIISRAHNLRETKNMVSAHAEMIALAKANKVLSSWRIPDCDMYVTLEPCIMCAGAIVQSRIRNIYYGAYDFSGGALGSSINILEAKKINHHPNVEGGILLDECSSLLSDYFKTKRIKKV